MMEKRKKILFMSSWYPVPENPTHGIFVQRHAQAVSLLNDVRVLYAYGKENGAEELIKSGSGSFAERIYSYNKTGKSAAAKLRILEKLYEKGFQNLIAEWGKPDLIHLNVIFPAGIFALQLARKYNIPYIITEHWTGYLPEDGSYRGLLKKYYTKKIVRRAKAVCPVSLHLGKAMQAHGLTGNYFQVPNVVDTDFFSLSDQKKQTETVFLHLSSFDERQKNPKLILDAFAEYGKKNAQSKLIMAGDGENIEELKVYIQTLNIPKEKIQFYFRPLGMDLLKLFHSADVLLLCSSYENLPVVILEAMSCGIPVISSDVGGISEYVNKENGILFREISGASLLSSMNSFSISQNNFEKEKIRTKAIENFSKKVIAEKFNKIYSSVTKKD